MVGRPDSRLPAGPMRPGIHTESKSSRGSRGSCIRPDQAAAGSLSVRTPIGSPAAVAFVGDSASEATAVPPWLRLLALAGLGIAAVLFARLLLTRRRLEAANAELRRELAATADLQQEREALEQNLRQLERVDSLGRMAGGFAHDFNNLLTGVIGTAQLLQASAKLDDETQSALQAIVETSRRAAGMCKDILAYAHTGGGKHEIVDVCQILAGLLPIARAGFGAGIELAITGCRQSHAIDVDRAQIEQLFHPLQRRRRLTTSPGPTSRCPKRASPTCPSRRTSSSASAQPSLSM